MTVCPRGMVSAWGSQRIATPWLGEHHEPPLGNLSMRDRRFGSCDLLERAADVDRARAEHIRMPPRDRAVERDVDLENARAIPKSTELAYVPLAGRPPA